MKYLFIMIPLLFLQCSNIPHINAQAEYINYTRGPMGASITIENGTIRIAPAPKSESATDAPTNFYLPLKDYNNADNHT